MNWQRRHTLYPTLFFLVWGTFSTGYLFSDNLECARDNPLLRNYFLQQHLQNMSYTDVYGRRLYRGNMRFLEQSVDRLIDDFLARVSQKLDALKLHFNTALRNREETLSGASDPRSRLQAQARWKDSMEEVADKSKALRRTLSYVLRGLNSKSDFKPEIEAHAHISGFQKEIQFIQEQILKAEQRIKDYFLLPTHTINLEDLQGQNMMIYLYRVEKMSKELSASLRY